MGIFDKKPSATDTSQDKALTDLWAWIQQLNKNQQILIANNNNFIKQIRALQDMDKTHDEYFKKLQTIIDALSKPVE